MRRDLLRLADLVAAADAVTAALDGVSYERFAADDQLRDAVAVLWRFPTTSTTRSSATRP
jgi:uncharacterized protein with HEPN domain